MMYLRHIMLLIKLRYLPYHEVPTSISMYINKGFFANNYETSLCVHILPFLVVIESLLVVRDDYMIRFAALSKGTQQNLIFFWQQMLKDMWPSQLKGYWTSRYPGDIEYVFHPWLSTTLDGLLDKATTLWPLSEHVRATVKTLARWG